MEIIPIIYIVLIIAVVLTIVTLTISFFTSRLKHKKDTDIVKNNVGSDFIKSEAKINTPIKSSPNSSDVRPVLKQNELRPVLKQGEVKTVSKGNEVRTDISVSQKKRNDSHKKPAQRNYTSEQSEPLDEKPRIKNERISVLKNLSTQRKQEVLPQKAKEKTNKDQSHALGDDILDKYVEEDGNNMFTIKVPKQKEDSLD